jgi:starch phosphorylase
VLDARVLTIVFARRFATYKRAVMLMEDLDRLDLILNNPERPVQIIFAGKAHPQDNEGKAFIRKVVETCRDPRFRNRMVFLENYDINVARYLVQGADIWLNNPRRPLEACGTSGMKAAANGCLNLSILDGWWDEGYEPGLGWAIGSRDMSEDHDLQDKMDAYSLYRILENEVVPLFYDRPDGDMPRRWLDYIKRNLSKLVPVFNTHRMLEDYTNIFYVPAATGVNSLIADNFKLDHQVGAWGHKIMENWGQVEVSEIIGPDNGSFLWGESIEIKTKVKLASLSPDDVRCEIYYGLLNAGGDFANRQTAAMTPEKQEGDAWWYKGSIVCESNGRLGIKIRVTPFFMGTLSQHAIGLVAWSK